MAKKNRMTIWEDGDYTVISLKEIEIWDGADLALLRETLLQLIADQGRRSIGIDMRFVKYIPSGFFGMLYDWHDKGVSIRLYSPQPHVRNMLWFRQFFDPACGDCYRLHSEPKQPYIAHGPDDWNENGPSDTSGEQAATRKSPHWIHTERVDSVAAYLQE